MRTITTPLHTNRPALSPGHTGDDFDSIDTVSSSSQDSSVAESDGEADINDAIKPTADLLADMVPPVLSAQAQAVQEANKTGKHQLLHAIAGNDANKVKKILRLAPYLLHERFSSGETPLRKAVSTGSLDMVKLLLQ